MTTLLIDSYNLIHRSRFDWGGGLAVGENQIIYNFLKSIKPILDKFSPDKVYFILDGKPKARLELDETYKANRKQDNLSEEEALYWDSFHLQKRYIINFVKTNLPFTTVYHPDFECDDILNYLANILEGEKIIVSSDTDFIQSLDLSDTVRLWNPVSQSFREKIEVDYAKYKAMVGDKTDNIPGVKGIGKVGAVKILKDPLLFETKMSNPTFKTQFEHSYQLVKFADISDFINEIQYDTGRFFRDSVKNSFLELGFNSMIMDPYFNRYCETMEKINNEAI
jgi:DNA polymerase-1